METLEQERWYSISELLKLAHKGVVPYKARQTWLDLINSGKLPAIKKGEGTRNTYMLQGKDITDHLNASKIRTV